MMAETLTAPDMAIAETRLIPSLTVSERYDSNVFFGVVSPGVKPDDYVTNVSPQLTANHKGQLLSGTMTGGFSAEAYVRNPGLNYIGFNGGVQLSLDNMIKTILPKATLSIGDSARYTPQPPAFFTPSPTDQTQEAENSFVRGLQAARVNSVTNNGIVSGTYLLFPNTTLQASYAHAMIRFGSTNTSTTGGAALNTTMQTATAGGLVQITRADTLNITSQFVQSEIGSGGASVVFQTEGATIGWTRVLTPSLSTTAAAGAVVLTPGSSLHYVGNASLTWKLRTMDLKLTYSRTVFPSFLINAAPLVSQVVTASLSQVFSERLLTTVNLNYGHSEGATATSDSLSFDSYGAGLVTTYQLDRVWSVGGAYSFYHFANQFGAQSFQFDRHTLTLTVKAVWN
jgi:hypothetical protein